MSQTGVLLLHQALPSQSPYAISGSTLQFFATDCGMGFEYVHSTFKADSCRASLDRDPHVCSNSIQAVAEPFFNIEEHCAITDIRGAHARRNEPSITVNGIHCAPNSVTLKGRRAGLRGTSKNRRSLLKHERC